MPKLTNKQTRQLSSRKTKTLLGGGIGKFFRRKTGTKTVPQNPSPKTSVYSVKTIPTQMQPLPPPLPPGRQRIYSKANTNEMEAMTKAHYDKTAIFRGATGDSAKITRVPNPLYSNSGNARLRLGLPYAGSSETDSVYDMQRRSKGESAPYNGNYVPFSSRQKEQPLYEPTPTSSPTTISSLAELITSTKTEKKANASPLQRQGAFRGMTKSNSQEAIPPLLPPRKALGLSNTAAKYQSYLNTSKLRNLSNNEQAQANILRSKLQNSKELKRIVNANGKVKFVLTEPKKRVSIGNPQPPTTVYTYSTQNYNRTPNNLSKININKRQRDNELFANQTKQLKILTPDVIESKLRSKGITREYEEQIIKKFFNNNNAQRYNKLTNDKKSLAKYFILNKYTPNMQPKDLEDLQTRVYMNFLM